MMTARPGITIATLPQMMAGAAIFPELFGEGPRGTYDQIEA